MSDLTIASSGGFLQLGTENGNCHNYGPGRLVHRCPGWSIPGHEVAQFHRVSAQCVKGFEAFHKPLSRANGSESPSASEAVTGGDVTALDRLGGVTATAMQSCAHMAGERDDRGHRTTWAAESGKLQYHRTAIKITSAGRRCPEKAEVERAVKSC
jgi:hypothetical protein